jgi:ABC-type sugar transport system ATPase subunit
MTELAIEATGLTKSFGDTRALSEVGLAARRGSVLAVLGPNGAGKPNLGNWQFFLPARKDPLAGRNG